MGKKVKLSGHYGSFNKTGDVYEIRFERVLDHPVKQVWEAITQPKKLALWLGEAEVDLKVDGEVHIRFQDMHIVGQVLQFKNESLLEYTWTSQSFPGEISIVRFELFPEGDSKCKLVFSERLVPSTYLKGAGSGWHYILDTLSMVLDNVEIPVWSDDMRVDIFEQLGPGYNKILEENGVNKAEQPAAKAEMLIRKPVQEVYEAMVNPAITSKFWYTKGSARLDSGKDVRWEWEMYGASVELCAHDIQKNKFIAFNWPSQGGIHTLVEMSFKAQDDKSTFVSISEKGWDAADKNLSTYLVGQTEGWTMVLAGLKALLEFDIALPLVADRFPKS
jgi:uncharacterized protein YndB with AHSA1/START domain